jgi:hypothetical protein
MANPQASKLDTALQEAIQHHQAGRLEEAERQYRRILRTRPSHAATNNALGIALRDQGRLDEAAAVFRRVVAVSPDHAPAHSNLGNVLFQQGQLEEAEGCYRRALALRPDMPDALKNLGLVIVDRGRFEESHGWFKRHAELVYGKGEGAPTRPGGQVLPHKLKHDHEQREFVAAADGGPAPAFHLEGGERVPGRAVNPDSSGGEIAAKWQNNWPQVAVIDNLLTPEALEKLRRFCWRSTIWQMAHPNGYVGAMPEHGFVCPLLAQINEELRSNFPAILGEHPLLRWWGFKYDSRLSGINVHADFAAVNVNFWITPDDANLEPGTGGLVIYDKPAPLEWGFAQYNGAGQAVRDFLKEQNAQSVTVPYRANRAVIFDSDLFHETDKIVFREGYTNRRLNITMLYGTRERAGKAS